MAEEIQKCVVEYGTKKINAEVTPELRQDVIDMFNRRMGNNPPITDMEVLTEQALGLWLDVKERTET